MFRVVLLLLQQRRSVAGSILGTTAKYLRRITSGATGNGLGTTIKYLRHTRSGAVGNGLSATIKNLRRATSCPAGNGLGTLIKYLRGAASIGLCTTARYMRRATRQRSGHHDQVSTAHNERRNG